jgi:translation elongation factor P/translation initiation factor 5A
VNDAIGREKQIKRWSREKKLKLIYIENPKLESLNQQLFDDYQVTKNDVLEIVNILKEKYLEQV